MHIVMLKEKLRRSSDPLQKKNSEENMATNQI